MWGLFKKDKHHFVTVDSLKKYLEFTDTQDDHILEKIVKAANNELQNKLIISIGNIKKIKKSPFFDRFCDLALTFCIARVRRDINNMYDEHDKILKEYHDELDILLKDVQDYNLIKNKK